MRPDDVPRSVEGHREKRESDCVLTEPTTVASLVRVSNRRHVEAAGLEDGARSLVHTEFVCSSELTVMKQQVEERKERKQGDRQSTIPKRLRIGCSSRHRDRGGRRLLASSSHIDAVARPANIVA